MDYFIGVQGKFGTGVGKLEWLTNENSWSLQSFDGQDLGQYKGVVVSDKNIVSSRFTDATGRPPPLGMTSLLHSSICKSLVKQNWWCT